ncbi:hypothetical protein D9758_004339 [Tetrapyrgos nigripes]|uniref:Thioesterase domain-containing protein n=1 Tax=Tetrapyrgos nigripes TaxID=182062 RepID=A0A8H5GN14_9AGAR|nr:hypothetical protein D9758_004339 [Tetrapyrgos nigripes]
MSQFPRNFSLQKLARSGSSRRFSTSSFRSRPSTVNPSNGSSKRPRTFFAVGMAGLATVTAYTAGTIYPFPPLALLYPVPAPPPPTDPTSPEYISHVDRIEREITSLPLLNSLRSQPDADEWYESRPYEKFPAERRPNHLTAGALRGPGRLAALPLCRAKYDETESYVFIHLGRGLCGHDGIIHGGLLATLLDETMARTAIMNLPERIGVTATLNISYRAPTKADQFVVMKIRLLDVQGRKANVAARVEDMKGTLLVEATGMFVQPRYAHLLNSVAITQVLGEPPVKRGEDLDAAKK